MFVYQGMGSCQPGRFPQGRACCGINTRECTMIACVGMQYLCKSNAMDFPTRALKCFGIGVGPGNVVNGRLCWHGMH